MPRKQKYSNVEKEYGVKKTNFFREEPAFMENQIVQIQLNPDVMDASNKLMEYTPNVSEPQGMEPQGLSEFQTIQQEKMSEPEESESQMNSYMQKRNQEIESELQNRQKQYTSLDKSSIIQWVDMESSKAYVQNVQNWPNVNIPCAWCLEHFDTISWPLVVGRMKDGTFKVRGHHCSPNCALAYGLDSREISESITVENIYSWMSALVYKITGDYSEIRPAPPRLMLQKFGGSMTVDMFRKECGMRNCSSYLTYPPLETSLPVWNRIRQSQDVDMNQSKEDDLVLKRTTPFYSSSLESMWQLQPDKVV